MATGVKREMVLLNDAAHLQEARAFVEGVLSESPFEERQRRLLTLAVDEAVTCLVRNAQRKHRPDAEHIILKVDLDPVRFKVSILDSQTDFHLDFVSERELVDLARVRSTQRLGIFLIQSIMDEMSYVYRRGWENEFKMVKFTPERG
jgi:anti-sigma regulatory factor (Ser/Thr protein kinase)